MKKENIIAKKTYAFALRIIKLFKIVSETKKEFVLSKQVLRSGTAIGALIREAEHGQSKADFLSKMSIALKEANETDYWLMLLKDSEYLSEKEYNSISADCTEIISILISIVKTTKTTVVKK